MRMGKTKRMLMNSDKAGQRVCATLVKCLTLGINSKCTERVDEAITT